MKAARQRQPQKTKRIPLQNEQNVTLSYSWIGYFGKSSKAQFLHIIHMSSAGFTQLGRPRSCLSDHSLVQAQSISSKPTPSPGDAKFSGLEEMSASFSIQHAAAYLLSSCQVCIFSHEQFLVGTVGAALILSYDAFYMEIVNPWATFEIDLSVDVS